MSRSRKASWVATVLAAVGLGVAGAALEPGEAAAQLRDPPLGWDMWDPGWTRRETWDPERMDESLRWRMTRHRAFAQDGVPVAYRGARNPLTRTPETVRAGGAIYAERCAACHDASGTGHGDAGLALYPSPALLAELIRMPSTSICCGRSPRAARRSGRRCRPSRTPSARSRSGRSSPTCGQAFRTPARLARSSGRCRVGLACRTRAASLRSSKDSRRAILVPARVKA